MATTNPAATLDLYNSYFNDPTFSDLTIKLSDRTVHVHRIVLCRASEYFTSLLAGRFQESASKEVELHEDDPEAMMALLRHIYGLLYDDSGEFSMHMHALVFVAAEKYQILGLQRDACENMRGRVEELEFRHEDFLAAVRTIFTATKTDSIARAPITQGCIMSLRSLRKDPDFMSLLRDLPDLGVEIIRHPDIECAFPGDWRCEYDADCTGLPSCPRGRYFGESWEGNRTWNCGTPFEKSYSWGHRHLRKWTCPDCAYMIEPICHKCRQRIRWTRRGLDGDESAFFDDDGLL